MSGNGAVPRPRGLVLDDWSRDEVLDVVAYSSEDG